MERSQELPGGIANQGLVVRVGDTVRRPAGPCSETVAALLEHLRGAGFEGVPAFLGRDSEGRDMFSWIDGDVPVPPYPPWSEADDALASVARLLRAFHEASRSFEPSGLTWSSELRDPEFGPVICHNDVCRENVVFRKAQAVVLLDFDFVAPGRPIWDFARTAGMWIPLRSLPTLDLPPSIEEQRFRRLRIMADAYGLDHGERNALVDTLIGVRRQGAEFVRGRAELGEPAFVEMWKRSGEAALEWTLAWLEDRRATIGEAVAR